MVSIVKKDLKGMCEVVDIGSGPPVLTFYVGVHGDEKAPVEAANQLIEGIPELNLSGSFRIVFANPRALKEGLRYTECDLNRSFPGKIDGRYEERVAYELNSLLRDTEYNFDFHGCDFDIESYGVFSVHAEENDHLMEAIGIDKCLFAGPDCLIKFAKRGLAFEVGKKNTRETAERALFLMKAILAEFGLTGEKPKVEKTKGPLATFLIYRLIRSRGYKIDYQNIRDFGFVREGTVIGAGGKGQELVAQEDFYALWVHDKDGIRAAKKIRFI